ncbi:hypothetical protein CAEBREN_20898 [Caenorhabditis brenneri]|uniref:CSD domain-containing protein n=1 Tax=Caenorhabditis brenneri TaxID=135651 RepID=G0MPV8_CAEBE|nr:hypothetical protein CAEBREN_20898 [Caenorhabditis brenneri]
MSDTTVEVAEEALEQKMGELSTNDKSPSNNGEKMRKPRLPTAERIRLWEEEQKAKNVITTGLQGKVKWYSVLRRYGFISRNDGEKDVFVHQTAIAKSDTEKFYLRTLGDEEEVLFDLVEGKNGPEAANVTGPAGANVVGSSGDAANSTTVTESSESASAAASPDSKSCSKIIDEEAALSKLDRCGSAMGDIGLGAQPIDAQI